MRRDQDPRFLLYVNTAPQDLDDRDGISSWVFRAYRELDLHRDAQSLPWSHHNASAGLPASTLPVVCSEDDGQHLNVEGILVDEVDYTTPECSQDYGDSPNFSLWLYGAIEALLSHGAASDTTCFPTEPELLQRLAVVLLYDSKYMERVDSDASSTSISHYLLTVLRHGRQPDGPSRVNGELDRAFANMVLNCRIESIPNRLLFLTASGRLGLGIGATRQGDKVVVVHGAMHPIILRPFEEQYQFVGAAYVYGIMQGEAVVEHAASGGRNQVFTLR